MRVAIYARISTDEERQNMDTQLMPVRDICRRESHEVYKEYTDMASARDIAHRTAWRQLLDDAAKHRFKVVLVFKLDRAFRSVKDMHDTLFAWSMVGVSFRSIREDFNTGTAAGRLMMNLLASLAEFELELIRERIVAGMERAARLGTRSGNPIGRKPLNIDFVTVCDRLRAYGDIYQASENLKCSRGYIYKVLKQHGTNPRAVISGSKK